MALGAWLQLDSLTPRASLKADLEEIDGRLQALEAALFQPSFYRTTGVPASTLGKDGDTALNTLTGSLYGRAAGAWSKVGEVWFDAPST